MKARKDKPQADTDETAADSTADDAGSEAGDEAPPKAEVPEPSRSDEGEESPPAPEPAGAEAAKAASPGTGGAGEATGTEPCPEPPNGDGPRVNSQITDAVTQTNVKNLGDAPGEAMAMLFQMMAQAVGLSMQNAVIAQQQMNALSLATAAQSINLILTGESTAAEGVQALMSAQPPLQNVDSVAATLDQIQQIVQPGEKAVTSAEKPDGER